MVLDPQVFDFLDDDTCVFEKTALVELANMGELMSYIHEGFWQCMDNIREKNMLENLLAQDKAPWKRWERRFLLSKLVKLQEISKTMAQIDKVRVIQRRLISDDRGWF